MEQIIENMQPKFKPKMSQWDKEDDYEDDSNPYSQNQPAAKEAAPAPNFRLWLTSMTLATFP